MAKLISKDDRDKTRGLVYSSPDSRASVKGIVEGEVMVGTTP
jgi:hypothetical protein